MQSPIDGEFWTLEPEKRLVGRLGADAALIMRGSVTSDVTGELLYLPFVMLHLRALPARKS